MFYIITRVHSSFSLVENRDLLEDRRTADVISVKSQSQHFRIINSQWRALFCIDYDHVKMKSRHYKANFGKYFFFIVQNK